MIQYKKGDLFSTTDKIIAHGCNAQGVMGAGVANQIRIKYPLAYKLYHDYCTTFKDNKTFDKIMGTIVGWTGDDKIIINLITQYNYGRDRTRHVSYDAFNDAWITVLHYMKKNNETKISIPKIGAGLGGGRWSIIESIIEEHTKNKGITVTVWEL